MSSSKARSNVPDVRSIRRASIPFRSRALPELKLAAAVAKAVLAAHPDAQEPESEKAPADLP
jgi:hypothetical protein